MASEERYRQVDSLIDRLLEVEPADRAAFLEKHCGHDPDLKRTLEELLHAHERSGSFMSRPALELCAQDLSSAAIQTLDRHSLGPYPVVGLIGTGGMGAVYRATDPRLGREVAIKVLPPALVHDSEAVSRFEREARAVAALSHPNVLAIHDFGRDGDLYYAVTELLEGETLRQRLERSGLSEQEAMDTALAVAQGLAAAHAKGIVHRDLKPENIFLTSDGRVKILDFGLARMKEKPAGAGLEVASTELTQAGTVLGTPGYMSPEQLRGEPAGEPSDVFSYGCVVYEMWTGQRAFARSSPAETAAAILRDPPPGLTDAGAAPPAGIAAVLNRCLQKNPADRYPTAGELARDLKRLQSGLTVPRDIRGVIRSRHRIVTAAIALGVLAVVVALLVLRPLTQPADMGFQERDWILITDLENETREEIFDKSLDTALRISVSQSSYVNVLSPSRISDALRRMRRDPASRIDRTVGREIAQRESARLVLVPAIGGFAGSYVLSASFEDPVSGNVVGSEVVRVRSRDEILDGVDQLVRRSRRSLGESLEAITRQSRSLVRVTTSSLEALKQYSLGVEKHRDVKLAEARSFYENALTVDPSFTAAMASLGMIHFEHFDRSKGKALLEQAAKNVDVLTERERYRILAFYARAVQDDLPQAIRYMQAFIDLYPDDCAGYHNLGWFHTQAAKYDEAIKYYQQAIRVDPSFMYSYDNLNRLYLYQLGEVSRAVDLCLKQLGRDPERHSAYDNLGWAYVGQGELGKARIAFEKAVELNPKSTLDLYRLAHVLRLQKQYAKAVEVLRRIPLVDPKARIEYDLGLLHGRMGNTDESRRYFLKHLAAVEADLHASPSDWENRIILAKVNVRLGRNIELRIPEPEDPEVHFLAANFHAVRKDPRQVIRHVEAALQRGWTNYVWLKLHPDMEEVKDDAEFQALLRRVLR